jgi:hypothetical protein
MRAIHPVLKTLRRRLNACHQRVVALLAEHVVEQCTNDAGMESSIGCGDLVLKGRLSTIARLISL